MGLHGIIVPPFQEASQRQVLTSMPSTYYACLQIEALNISSVGAPLSVLGSCEPGDSFRVKLWWGARHFSAILFLRFRLMLMSLYNVSINLKAEYISESPVHPFAVVLSGKGSTCRFLVQLVYLSLWLEGVVKY